MKRETVDAFDRYIAGVEQQHQLRFNTPLFIRSDRKALLNGVTVIEPAKAKGDIEVASGIIQDWTGAIFIPGVTLARTIAVVQDYARYRDIYGPEIAEAKLVSRHGNDIQVYTRIVKSKFFVSAVLDTENKSHFVPLDGARLYCRTHTTRIAEVVNPGKPNEHQLPIGKDRGLLWRMYGYWFFEERDGGVYVEYESTTLTRDVPLGMGRLLGPILHSIPAESLRSSLEKTRKAVLNDGASGPNTRAAAAP